MKKRLDKLADLAEERTVLAKERTIYSEERTFLSLIRTVVTVVGLFVFVMRIIFEDDFYTSLLAVLIVLFGVIVLVEKLYKFHKVKEKLKTLEERLDNS
ncbi:MAG: DUF202 domain-containing protein [DPANN group archaeon]|nr:DUF202 domain-containing protein [DPANN group archaeon]